MTIRYLRAGTTQMPPLPDDMRKLVGPATAPQWNAGVSLWVRDKDGKIQSTGRLFWHETAAVAFIMRARSDALLVGPGGEYVGHVDYKGCERAIVMIDPPVTRRSARAETSAGA